jgi:hypothetical protein
MRGLYASAKALAAVASGCVTVLNDAQCGRRNCRAASKDETMGYLLVAQDEYPHAPSAESHFNESVYCNGFDSRTGAGGWMRLGNRVNEGYAELSVCLYLPDGRIACQFQRPEIKTNAQFAAGGLSYEVKQSLRNVEMSYNGELLVLDDPDLLRDPSLMFEKARRARGAVLLQQTAASPVHGGVPDSPDHEPMYGWNFSLGHFNQHTTVQGEIQVDGERFPIDGGGWRDHSWGPRLWQNIYFYRLFLANLGQGRGFMLLNITNSAGRVRRLGVLLVDGEYEEVLDMNLTTEWTDRQDPSRVNIEVRTARRTALIQGEIVSLAPLRNRRKIDGETVTSRIAEGHTKFTWDGISGYGMTEYIERIEDGRLVGYPL